MSITGISEQDKIHRKAFHRRNDSGELDVFEAARYFSGATEVSGVTYTQKVVRDEKQHGWRGGRISLDVLPITRNSIPSQVDQNHQIITKEKKHKQPSSPGGRLASFLNSLFNHQTSSKKKKSKSTTTTQSAKEEDESPGGRRKRRSSISHFRTASAADSSNKSSIYSSSSSGFRTPPPLPYTPTKTTYKDLRSYSDHKPKYNIGLAKPSSTTLPNDICDEKFKPTHGFSEKFKNSGNGFPEKFKNSGNGFSEKMDGFSKFDDGAESDSSSDLFELENYDLGYYSSGLPVYETTHMDSIKRGAPISNGVAT